MTTFFDKEEEGGYLWGDIWEVLPPAASHFTLLEAGLQVPYQLAVEKLTSQELRGHQTQAPVHRLYCERGSLGAESNTQYKQSAGRKEKEGRTKTYDVYCVLLSTFKIFLLNPSPLS